MAETLERRAVFYDSGISQESRIRLGPVDKLVQEEATVSTAYFGRGLGIQFEDLGLHVWVDYLTFGTAHTALTNTPDIEGFMDAMGANTTEELAGKKVVAYRNGHNLVALSANE